MKIRKNTIKNQKAITLIALVVTIIILLILAGVTIGFAMNGSGLFEKAKLATDKYNNSVDIENFELNQSINDIEKYVGTNRDQVISQPYFIDTSRKITTLAEDTAYNTNSIEYTATENCVVTGYICMTHRTNIC